MGKKPPTLHDRHWGVWLERHGPPLLLFARQITTNYADAEEAVQQGFIRLWRSGLHERNGDDPRPLLYTMVRRAALDLVRQRGRRAKREETFSGFALQDRPAFEAGQGNNERQQLIEQALEKLPPDQRQVLVLKMWGEMTFAQVAETLGIPVNTAASRYRYALTALKRILDKELCYER